MRSALGLAALGALSLLCPALSPPANAQATTGAIVSEFRFRGAAGPTDEYVELYNTLGSPLDVSGWSIQTNSGTAAAPVFQTGTVPANTFIPARGHFLFTGSGYSLTPYGAGDASIGGDASDDSGVALFNAQGALQDAVGFTSSHPSLREGAGLASAPTVNGEYAFVREFAGTVPKDTAADSTQDFLFVLADGTPGTPDTLATIAGTGGNLVSRLGAPAPQGLSSPANINSSITTYLLDSGAAATLSPNRVRTGSGDSGTLLIRRTIANKGTRTLTKVRFTVTNIASLGTPITSTTQADTRLITSPDETVQTSQGAKMVSGTSLEAGSVGLPTQPLGGAMGSSVSFNSVLNTPLPAGENRNYSFLLQVKKSGNFSVSLNIEALSSPAAITDLSATPGNNQVNLTWTKVSDAASYKVFRSTTAGTYDFTAPLATGIATNAYADTAVGYGTTYFYVVRATNGGGDGASSNQAEAILKPFYISNIKDGDVLSGAISVLVTSPAGTNPAGGSLLVDGQRVGELLPHSANASQSNSFANLDATRYANGSHTIAVNRGGSFTDTRTVTFQSSIWNLRYQPLFGASPSQNLGTSSHITATTNSNTNWTVIIKNASNATVYTQTGSGPTINANWNGRNNAGTMQPDANYGLFIATASQTGTGATNSSSADDVLGTITKAGQGDSLVILDAELVLATSPSKIRAATLEYANYIAEKINGGRQLRLEYPVIPIILSDEDINSNPNIVLEINRILREQPLKLVYIMAHGRNTTDTAGRGTVATFRFGKYRWFANDPAFSADPDYQTQPENCFNVRELIYSLNYANTGDYNVSEKDPPRIVWMDTCESAGGLLEDDLDPATLGRNSFDPLNFNAQWADCWGITQGATPNGSYSTTFLGFNGSVGVYYDLSLSNINKTNLSYWRRDIWRKIFREGAKLQNAVQSANFDAKARINPGIPRETFDKIEEINRISGHDYDAWY